jgi:hypothetical protein
MLRCLSILVLLTFLVSVKSQERIPSGGGISKKQEHEATPAPQPTNNEQRGTEQAPLIVKVVPAAENEAETAQDAADREEKSANDRRLVIGTFVLGAVGILQLLVFGYQAVQLRKTVKAASSQSEAMERAIAHIASSAEAAKASVKTMEKQVHEMGQQRSVMQGQLDTMKGQLELEHRPWVAVNIEPSSAIVFDERGCVLMCKVTLTNVGHSVAKHVSLWTDFALLGTENPMEVRNKLCDIMRHPQNENSDYGWLLFPGQSAIEQRPIIAVPERVNKALENKTFQGMNAIGLHLVGCVDYPSLIDQKKRHQTRFEYIVSFAVMTNGVVTRTSGAFDPSKAIYQLIALTPTMHGASAD